MSEEIEWVYEKGWPHRKLWPKDHSLMLDPKVFKEKIPYPVVMPKEEKVEEE